MREWIKLYTEVAHDRKMAALTDRQFRVCINLFALAGLVDDGGIVPPLDDIAFQLRMNEADLEADMHVLSDLAILQEYQGVWMVLHWIDRQAKPPSASREAILERVHKHRAGKRNETVTPLQNVTNVTPSVTTRERERDKKDERDEKGESSVVVLDKAYGQALRAFENDISLLSGTLADDMADMWNLLIGNNTPEWWYKAIEVAVGANKREWRYMRGILQRCLTEGHPPRTRNGNGAVAEEETNFDLRPTTLNAMEALQ